MMKPKTIQLACIAFTAASGVLMALGATTHSFAESLIVGLGGSILGACTCVVAVGCAAAVNLIIKGSWDD